ncbi:MAG: hydroxymethylbilane synthase, partial [Thermomicrobiales bacterium]
MTTPTILGKATIRFGTRGSALALAQASRIADLWTSRFPDQPVDIIPVSTQGDIDKVSPLTEIGGRGVFTNAIEQQIVYGGVDAAIHSAKDMPSRLPDDLPIVAFPEREDPRDVLVSRHGLTLAELPPNPVIGTSSRRREAQVRLLRPDARIVSLRGNIDTRLGKAAQDSYDGVILAAAGIQRMGWTHRITEYLEIERFVPSPGQGALAIQTAVGGPFVPLLRQLDDPAVSGPLVIERAFLAELGAGCTMPVGAFVSQNEDGHCLVAFLADEVGERWAKTETRLARGAEREHAVEVARSLNAEVKTSAQTQWTGWRPQQRDLCGARVVVMRPRRQAGQLVAELARRGAEPLALPTIRIEPADDPTGLDAALQELAAGKFSWLVLT